MSTKKRAAGGAKGANHPCTFCRIVSGEAESDIVFADDFALGFLDRRPLVYGHVLLVPRAHYPDLAALPEAAMSKLAVRAKRLSAAVMQAMGADGSFVAINNLVSQSVPHVHVHVVPRKAGDGLFSTRLIWRRIPYRSTAQRAQIAARITAALQGR